MKVYAAPRRNAAARGELLLSRDEEGHRKGAYVTIADIDQGWALVTGVMSWDNMTEGPEGWVETRHLRFVLQTHSGFAAPDPQARIVVTAPNWLTPAQIRTLEDCQGKWIKAAVRIQRKTRSAWFRGACANQETTCDGSVGDPLPASAAASHILAEDVLRAARSDDLRQIQKLTARFPDIMSATTPDGQTLLENAMATEHKRAFRLLLKAGASTIQPGTTGETIVYIAARHQNPVWLRMLLDAGADPNTANPPGDDHGPFASYAPLGAALMANRDAQFAMLINAGADMTAADRTGNTALHLAAQINQPWHALTLLRAGADPTARNAQGKRFDRYLFMTPEHLLNRRNKEGQRAVRAHLAAKGFAIEPDADIHRR